MPSFSRHAISLGLACLSCYNVDAFTPLSLSPAFLSRSTTFARIQQPNRNIDHRVRTELNSEVVIFVDAGDDNNDEDDDNEEEEEEEEEDNPYMDIAKSEFEEGSTKSTSKSSALMKMATSSIDWGGEIGKLRQRMEDMESGKSQDPSNILYRLFSAKTPNQMIGSFITTANPEVIQAMSGAVGSLLGGLSSPQMGIETIVRANGEKLGNLCFQLQMTGYMFRNAEYVVALKNIMKIKAGATIQDYRDAFDRIDKDKSGYIEASEIQTLLDDIYDGKTPAFEIKSFIEFFDSNNDGRISWNEFEEGLGTAMARAGLGFSLSSPKNKSKNLLPSAQTQDPDDEDEDEDETDYFNVEPNVSGTIQIELKNGEIIEVEAKEYIKNLKDEAKALQAALKREQGLALGTNNNSPSDDSFTGITSYILERQGDLQSLTKGISPEVVDAMKMLVNFVIDGNSDGSSSPDRNKKQLDMEIPGSALQQLALWQLVLGYRLREAEATGEYLKLLDQ